MKCPKCDYNHKAKLGMKCHGCGYQFTFNPKEFSTTGLTDGKFVAYMRAASQNGTAWFTENQLYSEFCRRMNPWRTVWISVGLGWLLFGIVMLVFRFVAGAGTVRSIAFVFLVLGAIFLAIGSRSQPVCSPERFQKLLQQWNNDGKPIVKLITEPSLHEPPPEWSEPDIYDYGVERILIVERDILVDLLVKNGVHAEQRMLVLAESGYPKYLLPVAQRLLTEQPQVPIFLLHDATTHGVAMNDRIAGNKMLPLAGHTITDLGMFPTDFQKLKRTSRFDSGNKQRELPVDAMMLPFLTMGLGAAMGQEMTFSAMIAEQNQETMHHAGIEFG